MSLQDGAYYWITLRGCGIADDGVPLIAQYEAGWPAFWVVGSDEPYKEVTVLEQVAAPKNVAGLPITLDRRAHKSR